MCPGTLWILIVDTIKLAYSECICVGHMQSAWNWARHLIRCVEAAKSILHSIFITRILIFCAFLCMKTTFSNLAKPAGKLECTLKITQGTEQNLHKD